MNSSFSCISVLLKSNISKPCLINFLNQVSSYSLHSYLKLSNICGGISNKKRSDLMEMIIYGCINGKSNNKTIDDISINKTHSILKKKMI